MAGRAWRGLAALCLALVGWVALVPPAAGSPLAADCPRPSEAPGQRYVVYVPGFLSSSLTGLQPGVLDPTNHEVRDAFAPLQAALAVGLAPPPQPIYFSYGVARRWSLAEPPERAWIGDSFWAANEPRYWPQDTSDFPVQAHAEALGWLARALLRCDPAAVLDVVAYSLGGVVALRWAAAEDDGPDSPLAAVHRLVLLDSPVGGINPAILAGALAAAPPHAAAAAGSGLVLGDLLPAGEVLRGMPAALARVDVASIENSRDYLVNGLPIPGGPLPGPEGWLARGAAVSLFPPAHPDAYYADMGDAAPPAPSLWDYLVATHGVVLGDPSAQQRLVELLATAGPRWQARREAPSLAPLPASGTGAPP
jgi:hypothetical protein